MIGIIDVVVVGAGPAGIEAAISASQLGAEVVLIDSSPQPGGQYFKAIQAGFHSATKMDHQAEAEHLHIFQRLDSSNVQQLYNTIVWGIFEGVEPGSWCLTLHSPDAPPRLHARTIILATGASDRSVPFPGWDLPGVITTGAALTMVKNQRILPGKRILLAGSGPLQFAAAAYLVQAGAKVASVCESSTNLLLRGIPHITAMWGQWSRIREGAQYAKVLARANVPYRLGWAVTSTHGFDCVSQATIARLDSHGKPIHQSERVEEVDCVVTGYHLTPGTELARQIDCEFEYDHVCSCFIPKRDMEMQTSRPGIYAAGDSSGIGGAIMAMAEGRVAGASAASATGHLEEKLKRQLIEPAQKTLRREKRFARFLGDLFSPPAGLYKLAKDDTIICRCEQVTLGEVREAISYGAQTVNDIKNLVRTGMGNCQGRTCGNILSHILASETGKHPEATRYFNIRPPIHPLPLEVIEEYGKTNSLPGSMRSNI